MENKEDWSILNWLKSIFVDPDKGIKCDLCGDYDEEINKCSECGKSICGGCMADFISGNCLNCEES